MLGVRRGTEVLPPSHVRSCSPGGCQTTSSVRSPASSSALPPMSAWTKACRLFLISRRTFAASDCSPCWASVDALTTKKVISTISPKSDPPHEFPPIDTLCGSGHHDTRWLALCVAAGTGDDNSVKLGIQPLGRLKGDAIPISSAAQRAGMSESPTSI